MARYSTEAQGALVQAYYSRAVTVADLARLRAQNGFTVSSFLAAGLVGVGLLSTLTKAHTTIKFLGALAVVTWLVAVVLYTRAVAQHVPLVTGEQPDPDAFVDRVLENVKQERNKIDQIRTDAQRVAFGAALLTTATLMASLFVTPPVKTISGTVYLDSTAVKALSSSCGVTSNSLVGRIESETLNGQVVRMRPRIGICQGKPLHIRRDQIVVVVTE